ncbi:MAG: hypothetical protein MUO34_10115 [Ignavibacteriaceae bacterium]|nr:hypothetical protein [Ignavibacteriaceae bacterium]
MKTLVIIFLFASFSYANGYEIPDTSINKNQEIQKEQIQDKEDSVDKADSGEKDRLSERKKKDVFIDKDGDGISDNRQGGMSFDKLSFDKLSFDKLNKRSTKKKGSGGTGGGRPSLLINSI